MKLKANICLRAFFIDCLSKTFIQSLYQTLQIIFLKAKQPGLMEESHAQLHLMTDCLVNTKMPYQYFPAWQSEIVESKQRLEELIGKEVFTLVYPNGRFDGPTLSFESQYYKVGATIIPGRIISREGLLTVPRNAINL